MFMPPVIRVAGLVLLSLAAPAYADDAPHSGAIPRNTNATNFNQVLYKGLVGNALESVPMDPAQRVTLQRTNAVISNTWSGHSLSVLAKLSHPALLIGGLVWGLWAASNINSPAIAPATSSGTPKTGKAADTDVEVLTSDATPDDTLVAVHAVATPHDFNPASINAHIPVESAVPMTTRPRVIKVWLAQPTR